MRRRSAAPSFADPTAIAAEVAEVVGRVEGVAALGPGEYAEAATYGPSRKVRGVVVTGTREALRLRVHVVARPGRGMQLVRLARRIQDAVATFVGARFGATAPVVHVVFDDLSTEDGENA